MNHLQMKLIECGLSANEAKIYLLLLRNNNLKAGQIAKLSGIKRASTYTSLDLLVEKGLVSQSSQDGIFIFYAEAPARIKEYLQLQQKKLDEQINSVHAVESDLKLLQDEQLRIPKVSVFTGKEGLRTLLEKSLENQKEPILIIGDYPQDQDPVPFYTSERIAKKIKAKLITPKTNASVQASHDDRTSLRETKFIDNNHRFPGSIHISKNAVTLFTHSNHHSIGVLIQDNDLVETFKEIFYVLDEHCSAA